MENQTNKQESLEKLAELNYSEIFTTENEWAVDLNAPSHTEVITSLGFKAVNSTYFSWKSFIITFLVFYIPLLWPVFTKIHKNQRGIIIGVGHLIILLPLVILCPVLYVKNGMPEQILQVEYVFPAFGYFVTSLLMSIYFSYRFRSTRHNFKEEKFFLRNILLNIKDKCPLVIDAHIQHLQELDNFSTNSNSKSNINKNNISLNITGKEVIKTKYILQYIIAAHLLSLINPFIAPIFRTLKYDGSFFGGQPALVVSSMISSWIIMGQFGVIMVQSAGLYIFRLRLMTQFTKLTENSLLYSNDSRKVDKSTSQTQDGTLDEN